MPDELGLIATLRADFAREPGRGALEYVVLMIIRLGQFARGPARILWVLADRIVLGAFLGTEISRHARIGPGLYLPHAGRGVIIHPGVVVGPNCRIFPRVTLADQAGGSPRVGENVTVWSGAAVLGPVNVGAGAIVGVNSVVVRDVEPGTTVLGVPARPVPGARRAS